MPGSIFELLCPGCDSVQEISTGTGFCSEHREPWGYEQKVCPRCRRLRSQPAGCHFTATTCEECGGGVEDWAGRVWFERTGDEDWERRERVEGPCPACGTRLRESDSRVDALWD